MTWRVNSLTYSGPVTFGLKPSGGLWIDGFTCGEATSARMSATCIVYVERRSVLQSGSYTSFFTTRFLNGPYGNAFTVYRYMSWDCRNSFSRSRSCGSPVSVFADEAESRSDTPNVLFGDTRAFTCGT